MKVKTLTILGIKTNNLGDTIKENHFEVIEVKENAHKPKKSQRKFFYGQPKKH